MIERRFNNPFLSVFGGSPMQPGWAARRRATESSKPANLFGKGVVIIGLLASGGANAATYYVAANGGSDSYAGSLAAPFKTINRGVAAAVAGDTVYVRSGTYYEAVKVNKSGTAAAPLKISAYPGELPIVDGQTVIPASRWGALFELNQNYIQLSGFEVKDSNGFGVNVPGHHNTVRNCHIHHSFDINLLMSGDYGLAEDNRIWKSNQAWLEIGQAGWGVGLTAARDRVNGITDYVVLRRNTVSESWGEGLSTFEANGTLIEDNVVFNNYAVNLYVSDATNVTVQRNLVYSTPGNSVGSPGCGICLADETNKNFSSNITVVNNIVYGTGRTFGWWKHYPGTYMNNVLVAHNTFANVTGGNNTSVVIDTGPHRNVRFMNNIVQQDDASSVTYMPAGTGGVVYSNNLYSKKPYSTTVSGTDVIANAGLARSGSTAAGQLSGEWFKLLSSSPAKDKASLISSVVTDYFNSARGTTPDIGAHEVGGGSTVTPNPTPTPIVGANLALNKSASSSTVEGAAYAAAKAFDGSSSTRWSSASSDPQWVQVNLGAQYNINRVKLTWEVAYSASYKIQVSNDAVTWTDLYSTTSGRGGIQDLTSVTGVGQHVRILGLSRGTGWGHSLWEVEVFGTPR